jgi:hypothetical protein
LVVWGWGVGEEAREVGGVQPLLLCGRKTQRRQRRRMMMMRRRRRMR